LTYFEVSSGEAPRLRESRLQEKRKWGAT
jgi:hypothetical protein